MSRTFAPLTGNPNLTTIQPYIFDDGWGYQDAERARQALDLLAYIGDHLPLGGDEITGHVTGAATWEAVDPTKAISIDGDNLGGMTIEVLFFYKTENAAQAVQLRLRNTTDGSDAAVSTSSSSTTLVAQAAVTATIASGVKSYRLEILGGATHAVFGAAFLRIRKVPV